MSSWLRSALPLAVLLAGCALAADGPDQKDPTDKDNTSSRPHVRIGGIMIGAGYSHFSSPFGYPYYAYRPWGPWGTYGWPYYYDPFFYGPSLYPGYFTGFAYGPSMGEIKLKSADKDAWVYLDGALAGRAEKLKSMWLEPGAYHLEVRAGNRRFGPRVYVLSGKTLRLTADLQDSEVRS